MEFNEEATESLSPSIDIILPSSISIGNIWPESQHLVALPQGLQRTVTSRSTAVYLGFRILEILIECCFPRGPRNINESTFQTLRPWALHSCLELWTSFTTWTADVEPESLHNEIEALYLQSLTILALLDLENDEDFSWSSHALISFTSGLLGGIRSCLTRPFSPANQARFGYVLIRLQAVVQQLPETEQKGVSDRGRSMLRKTITDSLNPAIAGICHKVPELTTLEKDLQVCGLE